MITLTVIEMTFWNFQIRSVNFIRNLEKDTQIRKSSKADFSGLNKSHRHQTDFERA